MIGDSEQILHHLLALRSTKACALKVVNASPAAITSEACRLLVSLAPGASVIIELKCEPAVCNSAFCKPIPYIPVPATKQAPQQGFVEALSGNLRVFL